MKIYGRLKRRLDSILERIDNSVLRISKKGVPHIVIDSKYSVCYFLRRDVYKVFRNYGKPDNKKVATVVTETEVELIIKQLRKEGIMEDKTKKDIQRVMKLLERIISDLKVNALFCNPLEVPIYEDLINTLSAVQGEYAIEKEE